MKYLQVQMKQTSSAGGIPGEDVHCGLLSKISDYLVATHPGRSSISQSIQHGIAEVVSKQINIVPRTHGSTYKGNGIQLRDLGVESQAYGEPSQFLSDVLGVSRLGTVNDQGPARLLNVHFGRCLQAVKSKHGSDSSEARLERCARLAQKLCRFPRAAVRKKAVH